MTSDPRKSNITDIAEACHTSRQKAAQILKAAGLRRDARGLYLREKAIETINAVIDPARAAGHRAGGDVGGAQSTNHIANLATAKALSEQMRARKLELEIAQREGRLVAREEVETNARNFATFIRSAFLGLGPSIAPQLVGKSADEIANLIDADVRTILERLSNVEYSLLGEIF